MPYSQKGFGRTMNKKSLCSETSTLDNQQNCCEVRKVDNGGGGGGNKPEQHAGKTRNQGTT
jgi:hypothetical protein